MFIFTERSANKEFERLLAKLDGFETRFAHWKDEMALASKIGFETDETRTFIRELEMSKDELATDLRKARLGIMMGAHHWREALPLLKATKMAVRFLETHLNQLDASVAEAKQRARQRLGSR